MRGLQDLSPILEHSPRLTLIASLGTFIMRWDRLERSIGCSNAMFSSEPVRGVSLRRAIATLISRLLRSAPRRLYLCC